MEERVTHIRERPDHVKQKFENARVTMEMDLKRRNFCQGVKAVKLNQRCIIKSDLVRVK